MTTRFLPFFPTFLSSLRDRNQEDVKSFGEARLIDQAGEIPSIILTSSRNIVHVLLVLLSSREAKPTGDTQLKPLIERAAKCLFFGSG